MQRLGLVILTTALGACCGGGPCVLPSSDVLVVAGYEIVKVTSDCGSPFVSNGIVQAGSLEAPATCHFDARLDDGQTIHFDVLFSTKVDVHCCGTFTRYTADTPALVVVAPPGYKPHVDAGVTDSGDSGDATDDVAND